MSDIDTGTQPSRMQESYFAAKPTAFTRFMADVPPVADVALRRHQRQDGADHLPQPRVSASRPRATAPLDAGRLSLHAASTSATVFGIGGPSTRLPDFVTSTSSSMRYRARCGTSPLPCS